MPRLSKAAQMRTSQWRDQIELADELKRTSLDKRWRETLSNWRGGYRTGAMLGEESVPVNVAIAIANIIVPSIYYRDPTLVPIPKVPGIEDQAQLTAELLNYYMREQNFKRQVRRVATDAVLFDEGHFKIGWMLRSDSDFEVLTDPDDPDTPLTDDEGNTLFTERQTDGTVFRSKNNLVEPFMDSEGNRIKVDTPTLLEYIRFEQPYAIRWSPWDVFRDPNGLLQDNSDAEWVCFRSYPQVVEVRNNPFYENNRDVQPTDYPDYIRQIREFDKRRGITSKNPDRAEVWEIYFKEYNKVTNSYRMRMLVLAKGHDKPLFDGAAPFKIEGFPLTTVSFMGDPERREGLSMIEVIRPQIDSLNKALSQMATFRDRFSQKYLYNSRATSEREAERFARGRIASVIGLNLPPDQDVQRAFRPAEIPPLGQEVLLEIDRQWDSIQRVSGINEHHMGGAGVARQATQANFIESALGVRLQEKADLLADGILDVMRKWKQLLQQFGDYDTALKITRKGEDVWEQFTVRDMIPDDLDFTFDIHTSGFQARNAEKGELFELANLITNIPGVNPLPVFERLVKLFGFPDTSRIFPPQAEQQATALGQEQGQASSLAEGAVDTNTANQALNEGANAVNAGV